MKQKTYTFEEVISFLFASRDNLLEQATEKIADYFGEEKELVGIILADIEPDMSLGKN